MKESGEGIKIVDASQEVFSVMVEFIYDKKLDWASFSLSFLASLYYLAEKYNIKDLMEKILINIKGFKVVKDNVMNVGVLGEQNVLFTPLSDALYDAAAVFLSNYFKNRLDMAFIYFSEVEASPINS